MLPNGHKYYSLHPNIPGKVIEDAAYPKIINPKVAVTNIGNITVSTICLITSKLKIPPDIFETMIFYADGSSVVFRYPTYKAAYQHHNLIVKCLKNNEPVPQFSLSPDWIKDYVEQFSY